MENSGPGDESRAVKKARVSTEESSQKHGAVELSYVEFYAGIGGWTMAIEIATRRLTQRNFTLRRIAALDHSDLCTKAFNYNFGSDPKSYDIQRLTVKQVEDWHATIWAMSPPCQPHTRQHSNQTEDLKDPRSASFLHLIDLLSTMEETYMPKILFLENVVGFESSKSFECWCRCLSSRAYRICSFHLTPTQVGLPNDRPRYFCVAYRPTDESLRKHPAYASFPPEYIHRSIPEVGIDGEQAEEFLPCILTFLDKNVDQNSLKVPAKALKGNSAWCFDFVTPKNRRSSCFTSAYGKYNRGTGSVLYQDENEEIPLTRPEDREFDKDWAKDMDFSKLRYFSGMEMARLMGFPDSFVFPPEFNQKQQWKLVGNSLNVQIASKVVELGLRMTYENSSSS